MSVLVKGMQMPESCDECFFYDGGGCFVTMNIVLLKRDEDKPEWCPLVAVSEDAVSPCEVCPLVKEMNANVDELVGELYGEDGSLKPRYCDRNICASNEVNGIGCDECVVGCDGYCEECPMGEEKNK